MTRKKDESEVDSRVSSRRVYNGRVISLDLDTVRYPNGSQGELEVVRHPGASAVVPLLSHAHAPDPKVLLLRQFRHATGGFLYEIPAGRLEPGETAETCAHRELAEETGYLAGAMYPLLTFFTTPGFTDERIHAFVATDLEAGAASNESDEFIELVAHSLSYALSMIRQGGIQDAKTALTLMYLAHFRPGL